MMLENSWKEEEGRGTRQVLLPMSPCWSSPCWTEWLNPQSTPPAISEPEAFSSMTIRGRTVFRKGLGKVSPACGESSGELGSRGCCPEMCVSALSAPLLRGHAALPRAPRTKGLRFSLEADLGDQPSSQ